MEVEHQLDQLKSCFTKHKRPATRNTDFLPIPPMAESPTRMRAWKEQTFSVTFSLLH